MDAIRGALSDLDDPASKDDIGAHAERRADRVAEEALAALRALPPLRAAVDLS